ncbi:HYC_CC_PP family protein [Salegentibacter sediminis]|uniref:HYC_CC_PP family protein n=1 Tax=Salegentibacter sediminis TaxID=1930251 RepID=UPI0009C0DA61|nr:hypothetical protein [Salegentibacter sediminis]
MKKAFQNSGSVLLALLVMFSTFSFTVDKHFCGSFLVDKAIFSEAETCGMEMENSVDNCCTNEKVVVDGQDELKHTFESLDFEQQLFIASFSFSYLNLFETLPREVVPFKDYSPPLIVSDIQLEDQVFLI